MAQIASFRQSLPRQGLPGGCRNPVAREGLQALPPCNRQIPAIPAGMTLLLNHPYNRVLFYMPFSLSQASSTRRRVR
ncbi:MAG: hypothetical protein ACRERV_10030, partial [Methylococcales bacterium]